MTFDQVLELLTGEAGVVALLLLSLVLFFRGGIVTGKAHEKAMADMAERIEQEQANSQEQRKEAIFWRDAALKALVAAEKVADK